MKKWFLKYKDDILKAIITSVVFFCFQKITEAVFNYFLNHKEPIFYYLNVVLSFSFVIRIYQILLFIFIWFFISGVYREIKNRNLKLKIIEAKYFTEIHSVDITNELNDAIENNKLKIVLSNNIAGDPHKGVVKKATIKYRFNGQENQKEFQEESLIQLP